MATGALDSNGVWIYGEDDPVSPFSDYSNLGMDSVSDAIGDAKARLDAIEAEQDDEQASWTSYTPTLTVVSGTNPTLGSGSSVFGYYKKIGKTVHIRVGINFGSSGVAAGSGTYIVSLPFPPKESSAIITYGIVWCYDATGVQQGGACVPVGGSMAFRPFGFSGYVTNSTPFTWAASDALRFSATYEVA